MTSKTFPAKVDALADILGFVEEKLENCFAVITVDRAYV